MITTSNIYFAGYLLTEDAEIVNVETALNSKAKRYVQFHFSTGDERADKRIEENYERGNAEVNIRRYVDNLARIRDIVYRINEAPLAVNGNNNSGKNNLSNSVDTHGRTHKSLNGEKTYGRLRQN